MMSTKFELIFLYVALILGFSSLVESKCRGPSRRKEDDIDPINYLIKKYGDKLFEEPKNTTGDKVAAWCPEQGINVDELGEYPEGDILFRTRTPRKLSRNGFRDPQRHWPDAIVPFVIDSNFGSEDVQKIKDAIDDFHSNTCIQFVDRSTEDDYVFITNYYSGCFSAIGRAGGDQLLNLQTPGCVYYKGTIVHELTHAIGFFHEHTRWERDDYVDIFEENIEPGRESQFEKTPRSITDDQGVEYDYGSVMHYDEYAFSKNGKPTILPKVSGVKLGQRDTFSPKDIIKINRMYKC